MTTRYLIISLLIILFSFSCEEDEVDASGTGIVSFSIEELREVENATIPLQINIAIENVNHAGGMVMIDISGGDYGSDYETSAGSSSFSLEIPKNSLLTTFSLNPIDDNDIENDTQLTITITGVSGALELGSPTSLNVTLIDNDNPAEAMVDFESESLEIQENDTASTTINIDFDQASSSGGTITLEATGDAVFGTDYTIEGEDAATFEISVAAGASSASFDITPIDNDIFEEDKTIIFTITDTSGGINLGSTNQTTVTLVNDDAPQTAVIDFSSSNSVDIDEGAGTVSIQFDITGTTTEDATLELTSSGTAVVGEDFSFNGDTTNPFSITVPSGSSSFSIDLIITDDMDIEDDETIVLDITNVTGGLGIGLNQIQYTATLTDNDEDASASTEYVETFEDFDENEMYDPSYLDIKGFDQYQLTTYSQDNAAIFKGETNGNYPTLEDQTVTPSDSGSGVDFFFNGESDSANPVYGDVDIVLVTPGFENANGTYTINIDARRFFGQQSVGTVTWYATNSYTPDSGFTEGDWTVLGSEPTEDVNESGGFVRKEFTGVASSGTLYFAIRLQFNINDGGTSDLGDGNYRARLRFDNIQIKPE